MIELKKVFKLVEVEMKDIKKGDRFIVTDSCEQSIDIGDNGAIFFKAYEDAKSQDVPVCLGYPDNKLWGVEVKDAAVPGGSFSLGCDKKI